MHSNPPKRSIVPAVNGHTHCPRWTWPTTRIFRLTSSRLAAGMFSGFALMAMLGCGSNAEDAHTESKSKPAEVKALPKEANLAEIILTQQAHDRIGITTAAATRQVVTRTRKLGGEIMVPPGESAIVVAPVPGTVQPPESAPLPKPGSMVAQGQVVFRLQPLLTPERFVPTPAERAQIANAQASLTSLQMTADSDVRQLSEQVTAAEIALRRAEQLLRDRAGSERSVDDARAQLAIAEAGLRVAEQRKSVLDRLTADIEKGAATPIDFASPISGVVRSVPVTIGQTVSTGTTVFEVINLDEVWIRVPVYVGLLNEVQTNESVPVTFLGRQGEHPMITAMPVQAPPAADPLASTVDLYYRFANPDGRFRPGERVIVTLPMSEKEEAMTVPAGAILYDIYGSSWVYLKLDDLHFRRQRVSVRRTTESDAIVRSGLHEGDEVVVNGAAELFGTEFGTGK